MASRHVETMADSGEGGSMPDLVSWLKENRLQKKFGAYFEEYDVIIDDLLKYDEKEMNELIDELNIKAMAYKKRFKDAVRDLQFKYNKETTNDSSAQIYRVVMTTKESSLMDTLKKKLKEIDISFKTNTQITAKLLKDTQQIDTEIENVFTSFINRLKEREKWLRNKVNKESNKQLNILKLKQNNLHKYMEDINKATKQQNGLVLDPNIDAKKRENKIEEITTKTINGINNDHLKADIAVITFNVDRTAINKYISSIGSVCGEPEPPILNISDITPSKAKVVLRSSHNNNAVRYSVKYRKTDDDDEKKLNWNQVNLNNNEHQTVLHDLQQNTNYNVSARYKLLEASIWSRYCQVMAFKTKDDPSFKWDDHRKSERIILSNNDKTATNNDTYGFNGKFVSKNLLSKDQISTVHWEVTIKKRETDNSKWYFGMGYIEQSAIDAIKYNQWLGAQQNECSVYMVGQNRWHKYENTQNTDNVFGEKWKSEMIEVGDRLALKFDFVKNNCVVYYNDELVGTLTHNLPNNIYPAAVLWFQQSIETTKWIVQSR